MCPLGKLCIAVYVFGTYTKFIPYYVYSVLKSYPDYHVKIFIEKELTLPEKKCLTLIKHELSDNFSILENFFPEYDFLNDTHIFGGGKKILRWLIPEDEFGEFDYVYIGDVDFLIIREEPSLLESHLDHCERTQLPFSNKVRKKPDSNDYGNRLSGLHFYIKKPYYEKLGPIISAYLKNRNELIGSLSGINRNEHFLYYLVKQGFDLVNLQNDNDFRPHHGIHLGFARGIRSHSEMLNRLNSAATRVSLRLDDARCCLDSYLQDHLFQDMLEILPVDSIFYVYDALDIKMPNCKLKIRSYLSKVVRIFGSPCFTLALWKKHFF